MKVYGEHRTERQWNSQNGSRNSCGWESPGMRGMAGRKLVSGKCMISLWINVPLVTCVLSILMSVFDVPWRYGSRLLRSGYVLFQFLFPAALWSLIMIHLWRDTWGCPSRGLVCLRVELTGTGAPDWGGRFLAGKRNLFIGWSGAFDDNICVASSLSVSRCTSAAVTGDPGEEPERARERKCSPEVVPTGVIVSKKREIVITVGSYNPFHDPDGCIVMRRGTEYFGGGRVHHRPPFCLLPLGCSAHLALICMAFIRGIFGHFSKSPRMRVAMVWWDGHHKF